MLIPIHSRPKPYKSTNVCIVHAKLLILVDCIVKAASLNSIVELSNKWLISS